jgi:enoyl-CoA hydratase
MLEIRTANGIAIASMAHGKVNALDIELVSALSGLLERCANDSAINALVLGGRERAFSAGIDLKRVIAGDERYLSDFLAALSQLFIAAFVFPKPLVAAITGPAMAGGCVLACAADHRVAADTARIGIPEARVGVPFPVAGMEIMRYSVTSGCFRRMMSGGATFAGDQAIAAGLADAICSRVAVHAEAEHAADQLRQIPGTVFALTKRQQRWPAVVAIERGQQEFDAEILSRWKAPETQTAIANYVRDRLNA